MPMREAADFPGRDFGKDHCAYCARPDGSLKDFEEMLAAMSQWIVQSQGFDAGRAKVLARELLQKQPAWRPADAIDP